jgi:hypothetical protein
LAKAGWIILVLATTFRVVVTLFCASLVTEQTCGPYVPWKMRLTIVVTGVVLWAVVALFARMCLRQNEPLKDWTPYGVVLAVIALCVPFMDFMALAFTIAMC